MTNEQAARILDPETSREALSPYAEDCRARLAVMEEACRIAAKALRVPTGDPLTLEQLREMDGQQVLLETGQVDIREQLIAEWEILISHDERWFEFTRRKRNFPAKTYGIDWLAYAYPPAHIDREAWGPCKLCEGDKLDSVGFGDHFGLRIYLRGGNNKPPENERFQFCPKCGRPLTPEAWDALEKRLRGRLG